MLITVSEPPETVVVKFSSESSSTVRAAPSATVSVPAEAIELVSATLPAVRTAPFLAATVTPLASEASLTLPTV